MTIDKIYSQYNRYSTFVKGATGTSMIYTTSCLLHGVFIGIGTATTYIKMDVNPTTGTWLSGTAITANLMANIEGTARGLNVYDVELPYLAVDPTGASGSFMVIWRPL